MITTTAIRVTAVVALVAIAGVTAGGWYVRREQFAQLVTAAEAVDEVLDQWHADRAAVLADLPSAHYRTQEVEQRAAERLQRMTASTVTALDDATARVRRIRVALPWNAAVDVARDTYLHHIDRWSGHLERIVDEPVAGLDEPPPPLTASRSAAAVAFDAAMPPFAGSELRQRVNALLSHRAGGTSRTRETQRRDGPTPTARQRHATNTTARSSPRSDPIRRWLLSQAEVWAVTSRGRRAVTRRPAASRPRLAFRNRRSHLGHHSRQAPSA